MHGLYQIIILEVSFNLLFSISFICYNKQWLGGGFFHSKCHVSRPMFLHIQLEKYSECSKFIFILFICCLCIVYYMFMLILKITKIMKISNISKKCWENRKNPSAKQESNIRYTWSKINYHSDRKNINCL